MKKKQCISFIIPAYIETDKDELNLIETIKKINSISESVIVISQNIKPKLEGLQLVNYHSKKRLGKWGALNVAKSFEMHNSVFIHDADNPFKGNSYSNISNASPFAFVKRDKIILQSLDALSKNSRKYIELFLNKYSFRDLGNSQDIQSGAMFLERDFFKSINFDEIGTYGGELYIYNLLRNKLKTINDIDMEVEHNNRREVSNYTIKSILHSLIKASLRPYEIEEIIKLALKDYSLYISNPQEFRTEIYHYLELHKFIDKGS